MDAAGLGYAGEDTVPRFDKEKAAALVAVCSESRRWVDSNVSSSALFTGLSASFASLLEA